MNKKDLNYLLMTLGIFKSKQLDANSNINDDTHFTDSFEKTNEIITDGLNENEIQIALMAKQTQFLKSIKNILLFFMISFIAGMILTLLFVLKIYTWYMLTWKSNQHSISVITSFLLKYTVCKFLHTKNNPEN